LSYIVGRLTSKLPSIKMMVFDSKLLVYPRVEIRASAIFPSAAQAHWHGSWLDWCQRHQRCADGSTDCTCASCAWCAGAGGDTLWLG
jgi:hypothetical protein